MKAEFTLKSEKAREIRSTILDYIEECRVDEDSGYREFYNFDTCRVDHVKGKAGYYDGTATHHLETGDVEYETASGLGWYCLSEDNTLVFEGRRNSFLDGTAIFSPIRESDCESWEILESHAPERSPWR